VESEDAAAVGGQERQRRYGHSQDLENTVARRATGRAPIVSDSWILGRWRKGRAFFQPVRAGGRRRRRRELAYGKALLFHKQSWPVRGPATAGWRAKTFQKSMSWNSLGKGASYETSLRAEVREPQNYPDEMAGLRAGHPVHRYVAPSVRQSQRPLLHRPARSILVACSPTVIVKSN
jgi:hypothetical protein